MTNAHGNQYIYVFLHKDPAKLENTYKLGRNIFIWVYFYDFPGIPAYQEAITSIGVYTPTMPNTFRSRKCSETMQKHCISTIFTISKTKYVPNWLRLQMDGVTL